MKKLIIITLMTINLTAVDFGNGVNIAGKWNINTGSSLPITEFLSSMNNKWLVDFRTDGYVYDRRSRIRFFLQSKQSILKNSKRNKFAKWPKLLPSKYNQPKPKFIYV